MNIAVIRMSIDKTIHNELYHLTNINPHSLARTQLLLILLYGTSSSSSSSQIELKASEVKQVSSISENTASQPVLVCTVH